MSVVQWGGTGSSRCHQKGLLKNPEQRKSVIDLSLRDWDHGNSDWSVGRGLVAGLVMPQQITYEDDRGLPEGSPRILGILQALAEESEDAVSVRVHLKRRETPKVLGPLPQI